jgi:hypothetical protein
MVPPSGSERRGRRWVDRLVGVLLAIVLAVLACPSPARALEWGLINPGETVMAAVRGRYGAPTRELTQKVDGYDSTEWVYEDAQAPTGMIRMVVEFGLLTPQGYRPQIARTLLLHPKPGTFNRGLIVQGWGSPSAIGEQSGNPAYLYEDGLLVVFDREVQEVKTMLFTPRQTMPPPEAAPPR